MFKRLLTILSFFLFVQVASAAVADGSACHNNSFGGAVSTGTTAGTPTAGETIIAVLYIDTTGITITSIKDSAGNSFTVGPLRTISATREMAFAYESNIPAGLTGVTYIISGNAFAVLAWCPYIGLISSPQDAYDPTGTSTANGTTSWSASALTPLASNNEVVIDVIVARSGNGATACTASGFSSRMQLSGGSLGETGSWCENIVASTTGSYTPSGTKNTNDVTNNLDVSYTGTSVSTVVRRRASVTNQ